MIETARYLSMDTHTQYHEMEGFARWNLPEEIGLEWIDAEGIIHSEELASTISNKSVNILNEILNNFKDAFESPMKDNIWTLNAMDRHPFWKNQRTLARQFLDSVQEE